MVPGEPPIFRQTESRQPVGGQSIPFSPVNCFSYLELPAPGVVVIRDTVTWHELWARFYAFSDTTLPAEKVPLVDFDSRMALVVSHTGVGGCGRWNDIIDRIEEAHDTLWVHLRSSTEVDLGHCMEINDALQVVEFPRTESPIVVIGPYPEEIEERGWFRYTNEQR